MTRERRVLIVTSPLQGWCASLDDSPDTVFRGRMLGDGVSIDPTAGEVRAPFDAEVVTLPESRHAVNLRADNGAEFLIHVGIDTVNLRGDGFEAHVRAGERVRAGQLLLSFDLEKLLRAAPSLRTPVLLLQSDRYSVQQVRAEGMVQIGDAIFEVHGVAEDRHAAPGGEAADYARRGEGISRSVLIGLAHGVHARPAARMIEAISGLDASVTLEHAGQSADVRSAVAMMSLGTHRGDRVTVSASGADAQQALEAVLAGLEPLTDGEVRPPAEPALASQGDREPRVPPPAGSVVRALPASPGLGRGRAFMLGRYEAAARESARECARECAGESAGGRENEQAALDAAVGKVREHLQGQAQAQAQAMSGGTGADIARAHLALLADPMVADAAQRHLDRGLAATAAWRQAIEAAVTALSKVDDPRVRERADDLEDINLRVQRALAGEDPAQRFELPDGAIVVAGNLLPSQLLEMDRERLAGICLAGGGATSHVALLAISLQIPMLVAAGEQVLAIETGSELLVDADLGELHVFPRAEAASRFAVRIDEEERRRDAEAQAASQPCVTTDGVRIHFHANIGSAADARAAVEAGAEGCGLLRTEFVFMQRNRAPGVDDQLRIYREISGALGDRPLTIRTLDAGGDKPIAYVHQAAEVNPALGVRGIRLALAHPDLLEAQLRALSQLEHPQPVQVMLPMVSSVREVELVKEVLARLGQSGAKASLKLGVMIETPAAALIAEHLAETVDFFSIGTNDLTQYTLCMDRGEPELAKHFDALHPAVLRLIRHTVEAAKRAGIPVAVCGGAAGDPVAAPLLLGLGIRELSMPASLIARQKAGLRGVSVGQCEQVAASALEQGSAEAVRGMMREFLQK
jgi:phosphoenolpyruvate-protein phosphotransferase